MGAALYIALESPVPGLDNVVDGKALSRAEGDLTVLARQLGVRPLMDFFSMSVEEFEAMAEEHNPLAGLTNVAPHEEEWFPTAEGLTTIRALITHLQANPRAFVGVLLLSELEDFAYILDEAGKHGIRWHLCVDY